MVDDDRLVCTDILRKLDALVDLSVALQELEHRLMSSLAQPPRMLFEEFVKLILMQNNLLLCRFDVDRV
jgi:hypothetical protein